MKKGGYFIAVSRGKLYDAGALVTALETRQLAGAGLDVTDPEPLPKGHPLWKMENVIITPHIAGRSDKEHPRYIALYKENLKRFANGEPLLNVVDKQKGY
jgi:phosphoglycerate dehydrogenase-like enzyme